MKSKQYILFLFAACLCFGCSTNVPEADLRVTECATIPVPRACAAACHLNGKGYIFGGRTQDGKYLNDLWQYDPQTDTWTSINTFPGKARVHAIMIADGDALYMGLGFSGERVYVDSCYLKDIWRYTPADGQWEALTPCPFRNTVHGVPYIVNRKLYLVYSTGWSYSNDVISYDLVSRQWDSIPDNGHRAESCFAGAGGQCAGRCFFGTGLRKENLKQWYEMDLTADHWTRRTGIPGKGRELCAYCATEAYIYLFGGRYFAGERTGGEVFSEYMRYNVEKDQWERCGEMPFGRGENMISFSVGKKVYFGLGEDETGNMINKLYCIEE